MLSRKPVESRRAPRSLPSPTPVFDFVTWNIQSKKLSDLEVALGELACLPLHCRRLVAKRATPPASLEVC